MKRIRTILAALFLAALSSVAIAQSGYVTAGSGNVSVPQAGNTVLLTLNTYGVHRIFVSCAVTGQTLDAFLIMAKQNAGAAAFVTFFSVTADYTTPKGIMIGASGDLTVQAAGTTGWFIMDTIGLDSVQIQASSGNVAGSTVNCAASGN